MVPALINIIWLFLTGFNGLGFSIVLVIIVVLLCLGKRNKKKED